MSKYVDTRNTDSGHLRMKCRGVYLDLRQMIKQEEGENYMMR
jgi:hypothetical protein